MNLSNISSLNLSAPLTHSQSITLSDLLNGYCDSAQSAVFRLIFFMACLFFIAVFFAPPSEEFFKKKLPHLSMLIDGAYRTYQRMTDLLIFGGFVFILGFYYMDMMGLTQKIILAVFIILVITRFAFKWQSSE
jgi:hypothetical protein